MFSSAIKACVSTNNEKRLNPYQNTAHPVLCGEHIHTVYPPGAVPPLRSCTWHNYTKHVFCLQDITIVNKGLDGQWRCNNWKAVPSVLFCRDRRRPLSWIEVNWFVDPTLATVYLCRNCFGSLKCIGVPVHCITTVTYLGRCCLDLAPFLYLAHQMALGRHPSCSRRCGCPRHSRSQFEKPLCSERKIKELSSWPWGQL